MAEFWDIYDKERRLTGRLVERGVPMGEQDYHLVVQIWIRNSHGEWLISRRSPDKYFPLKWEATGGSAVAGEDSFTAALREVREELGVTLDPARGKLLLTNRFDRPVWTNQGFVDVYVFEHDCPIEAVVLQDGETCEAMWASEAQIHAMKAAGEMAPCSYWLPPFGDA